VASREVFGIVGGLEFLDLAKDAGEELVHLSSRGESRALARVHVFHASHQATLTGIRIAAELDDEDAGVGECNDHARILAENRSASHETEVGFLYESNTVFAGRRER
jgi:hypothetical protein